METTVLNSAVETELTENVIDVTTEDTTPEVGADYSTMSKVELIDRLKSVVESDNISDVKDDVEAIKVAFYKQRKLEVEAQRKAFLVEGGNSEEFTPEVDGLEQQLKDMLNEYRSKRNDVTKELEIIHNNNYQMKLEIIEKLKELISSEESIGETFNEFRTLQNRWKEVGNVPKGSVNDIWETYHHYTEQFYEYVKINNELRDIDLKKNYEAKIALCEKAEALTEETMVIPAFRELQLLHEQWREIGPVMQSEKDAIWNRFKSASTIVNKRHQDYFDGIKEEQLSNLNKKSELCERVEAILNIEITGHNDWEKYTTDIINAQKEWKGIGFAPKKDNNSIYERFRAACNLFFDKKQQFYTSQKEAAGSSIEAKIALCEQAEALQDSTDWNTTANELIRLQGEWKKLGFSSRKEGEALWKRFRAACDKFFDAKAAHRSVVDSEFVDNLKSKEAIIEEVKSFDKTMNTDEAINALKDIQRRWSQIGFIPMKEKNRVNNEFRDIINSLFTLFKNQNSENQLERFKDRVSKFKESSKGSMSQEREKLLFKLKKIEADITVWENNIGFFSRSKGAEAMIKDVEAKIEKAKADAKFIQDKLRILNN